jgi:hypothetical protein
VPIAKLEVKVNRCREEWKLAKTNQHEIKNPDGSQFGYIVARMLFALLP